ncbi:hypothetical protein B0H15DRAFT_798734 [Mycena belliarum]|uniref:Uncharacterized protein n=1 Tax=Mycena belliarum TaxID=1033014 RepID=A0AAD6XPU8_9AGAR|nr:hypothetical protein B0H15DRAFT_798734 [Mycena belliae]
MFNVIRRVLLAVGKSFAGKTLATNHTNHTARDTDPNAPSMASPTRQRTRTRTTSLKGVATCSQQSLQVEVTVATSPLALTAIVLIQHKGSDSLPVFVSTHTAIDGDGLASNISPEVPGTQDATFSDNCRTSERVDGAAQRSSAPAVVDTPQVARNENDAHEEILQNPGAPESGTPLMMDQTIESAELFATLRDEPGAVAWESAASHIPHLVVTPADEAWDDFVVRWHNQPNQQWVDHHLPVPLAISPFSPFGPTDPPREYVPSVGVFSPSRFAASVSLFSNHTPSQALFVQKHTYKAVAYVACIAGSGLRAYYDDPTVLQSLEKLTIFVWTDPAAPLLKFWRTCSMASVYESDHPFAGVPHIVVTGTPPNAPWEIDHASVPEQNEQFLTVPQYVSTEVVEEEDTDDKWYCGDDEEEEVPAFLTQWSESEEESDYARTPSPPAWSVRTYPASGRSVSTLDDVFEEDEEDTGNVPSVLETRFRKSWLQDDDDDDILPPAPRPPPRRRPSRFRFTAALPDIDERTHEDVYRPLAADYQSLWTGTAMIPISKGDAVDDSTDGQSQYTDALDHVPDSASDSQYLDAEEPETDADQTSESEYGYRARCMPRPSCDIFLSGEDSDLAEAPAPRGKANIPAGKTDWFDLLDDDDLGSPEWT